MDNDKAKRIKDVRSTIVYQENVTTKKRWFNRYRNIYTDYRNNDNPRKPLLGPVRSSDFTTKTMRYV